MLRALSIAAVFLGAIQALVGAVGAARLPMTQAIAIAIGVISGVLALAVARALREAPARASWLADGARVPAALAAVVVIAIAVHAVAFTAAWFKPDFSWDGATYHTPIVSFWAQRGYVHWVAPEGPIGADWEFYLSTHVNGWARGGELMSFFIVRALGTSRAINTATFWFLPLGAFGIAHLARALGASPAFAALGAALYLLVPVVVAQSMTTYVDAAYASCAIALLAVTSSVSATLASGAVPWRSWVALGCTLGLTLATKAAGPVIGSIALAAVVVSALVGRRRSGGAMSVARAAAFVACATAIGVAIGGQWYVRNWTHAGNPVHPVGVRLLGARLFPGFDASAILDEGGNLPPSMRALGSIRRVVLAWTQGGPTRWPSSIRYYDAREGGLGYLWLLGCLPAIAVCAVLRRRSVAFVVLAATAAAAFVIAPMNWWARYTIWIYALGLPCFAVCASRGVRHHVAIVRVATGAWIAACVAVGAFEATYVLLWEATPAVFVGRPRPPRSIADARRVLTEYPPTTFIFGEGLAGPVCTEALTSDATVAVTWVGVSSRPVLGQLAMPIGFRRVELVDVDVGHDDAALDALRARTGAAYVLWGLEHGRPEALERRALRVERYPGHWDLYELAPPSAARSHAAAK